jgi:hypothetical protein
MILMQPAATRLEPLEVLVDLEAEPISFEHLILILHRQDPAILLVVIK